jgi:phage/plasmid-associated DNA primase
VEAVRKIVRGFIRQLGLSEVAMLEDHLRSQTGLSQRAVYALTKESRNYVEGFGYLNSAKDIVDALWRDLTTNHEAVVCSGTGVFLYEASAGTDEEKVSSSETTGFFQSHSLEQVERHMLELFDGVPALESKRVRQEVLTQLRMRCEEAKFFLDAPPGVNVRNGFVRLDEAGELRLVPHSPAHKARMRIEADYDAEADIGWLEEAISRTLPDKAAREALQEVAGAILFNVRPAKDAVRCMYIMHGARNSGKSTIINMLTELLPSEVVASVSPKHWGDPNYRAALENVQLNVVTELGGNTQIGGEEMKKIVSWEPTIIRRMRRDPVSITLMARHLFATNELPRIVDKSDAFERRLLVISFPHSLEDSKVDGNFSEKLKANPSAILRWAAVGAARLIRNGRFTLPPGHAMAAAEMRFGSDLPLLFAHTQVRQASGGRITTADLRDAMKAFWRERGQDPEKIHDGDIRKVVDVMQHRDGATRHKSNGKPFYQGVSIVSHTPAQAEGPEDVDLEDL